VRILKFLYLGSPYGHEEIPSIPSFAKKVAISDFEPVHLTWARSEDALSNRAPLVVSRCPSKRCRVLIANFILGLRDPMCGICGVVGIESKETGEAIVRRMMRVMIHRGPDEEGLLAAPQFAAGTRRLSIIDLPGGNQPVWNEAGTLAVFFNGEIYNFLSLRAELEASGHKFRTRSDTEVIVEAYQAWGQDCVQRLRGMFAFAVVEMPEGRSSLPARVFVARDRLGIKPLYYVAADGLFLFASEVRALVASGCLVANLSEEALSSYLLFGSVSEPLTLIEGVTSLPPGHSMTISIADQTRIARPEAYWDIEVELGVPARQSQDRAIPPATRLRSLLEDSVRCHLVADVPIGVFLSSGLDSTAIATLASRAQNGIHTFTLAFPDAAFSEAEIASSTAKRQGTNHSELAISDGEMVARLDEAVAAFDQPSMDGINTYFVSWAARQAGLKVALSGLGSDELFGGYSSFPDTGRVARLAAMARFVPNPLRAFIANWAMEWNPLGLSPDGSRKAFAAWLDPRSLPHPYFFTRALFASPTAASWLREDGSVWSRTAWGRWLARATRQTSSMDSFTAISWLELRSYLVNTLLRDTDAMSMHHSLEVRVPFLDSALVEYMLSLPESEKRLDRRPKALLVRALGDLLPQEVRAQPKRTFTFPWENWLRGPLGKHVAAGLADWSPALESRLSGQLAGGVFDNFLAGRTTWSRPWSLYVLNEWAKRNLGAREAGGLERAKTARVSIA
jgi:asparagine synthase (glutamine-hydrolysing)